MHEHIRCADQLPDLPDDRFCLRHPGHEGPHNDNRVTWTSEESAAIRERVTLTEHRLMADAGRAAREAVLGVLEGARKGAQRAEQGVPGRAAYPNRKAHRKAAQDARKRRL